ncbi:MAG: leucine--tRNA ligase [Chloroflexota bacterium]|nr:leucine--tRNA ligase [Chloroflexota bacterium]
MTEKYSPQAIESKWQRRWDDDHLYRSHVDWSKPKHYAVTMLPYPSGDLHIGHWFAMTPSDTRARWMRMKGYNVLFPMGFDAFGLPAEYAAISRGIHPATWTIANIERMRGQMRSMGAMFDWEREMVSCEPEYYRWTQWFFKIFYEHDLAFRGEARVNWSPTLQTVLANEQVIDGKDERTGQPVVQKLMTQWFFRYTRYADELLNFDGIDWPEPIRIMQTNWIGRSEGARVVFKSEAGDPIEIYTTRPDTLWGATFMVLAPEHPLVASITSDAQRAAVADYQAAVARLTEIERTGDDREKTGVFTGGYAINPVNGERIPVWIADYVLVTYGTGAIMAVPAHDERDYAFAKQFGLKIQPVIKPADAPADYIDAAAWTGDGAMINSAQFDGTLSNGAKGRKNPAINAVIDWLSAQGVGREAINYRLRDWLISRQRYWGCPIPMIFRADGGVETVRADGLPVELPHDVKVTGVGNPLVQHESFINAHDSSDNPARRETDTMDTFMCSSWYHLRYLSPHYDQAPFDPEEAAYWLPVDVYTGGAEHATMHLLYARWFDKALRDLGVFDDAKRIAAAHGRDLNVDEPYLLLRNQGQILGEVRKGDIVVCVGEMRGEKMFARRVEVVESIDTIPHGAVAGEIMRRTENIVTVATPTGDRTVEVLPDATIAIPSIPGTNTVNQLKQHLDIQRMSKSRGNVVNPDDWVQKYGADTVRAYLMFGFDWIKGGPWDSQGIQGVVRWLNDMWEIVTAGAPTVGSGAQDRDIIRKVHQTIQRVENSLEAFSFNTAIAGLMELKNAVRAAIRDQAIGAGAWRDAVRDMLLLMAPFTPHVAEELWAKIGGDYSIHTQPFPVYDAAKAAESETTLVVMKNGKPIELITVPVGISEDEAKQLALASNAAQRILNGGEPKKVIYIAGRASAGQLVEPKVNIVV